jgi:hypothetical protein
MYWEDDEQRLSIFREMNDEWLNADKIEKRPSSERYDIYVARFHDHSELLIEWWHSEDMMNVSYRAISYNGWQAPAQLTEIMDSEGGQK